MENSFNIKLIYSKMWSLLVMPLLVGVKITILQYSKHIFNKSKTSFTNSFLKKGKKEVIWKKFQPHLQVLINITKGTIKGAIQGSALKVNAGVFLAQNPRLFHI